MTPLRVPGRFTGLIQKGAAVVDRHQKQGIVVDVITSGACLVYSGAYSGVVEKQMFDLELDLLQPSGVDCAKRWLALRRGVRRGGNVDLRLADNVYGDESRRRYINDTYNLFVDNHFLVSYMDGTLAGTGALGKCVFVPGLGAGRPFLGVLTDICLAVGT